MFRFPDGRKGGGPVRLDSFSPPGMALSVSLGPNRNGRDLVVGDVHGHFATLRRALAELEFAEGDRLFSLGDLIDRGPASFEARAWIAGRDPSARFDLVLRGNHEQMMLEALASSPLPAPGGLRSAGGAWGLWRMNGGGWWHERGPEDSARAWMDLLKALPFSARIKTPFGPVGLVHACPVFRSWRELEDALEDAGPAGHLARARALWSRIYYGRTDPYIGESGDEWQGAVEGVRAVLTGHTSLHAPLWRGNVLGIDTGIHYDRPEPGRLTIARIDTEEIETFSFDRA